MVLQRKVIFDISLPHELIHASFNTSALNPTCVTTQYIYLSFFCILLSIYLLSIVMKIQINEREKMNHSMSSGKLPKICFLIFITFLTM